jgi:outer membrane receptor protein involved in Fe transport
LLKANAIEEENANSVTYEGFRSTIGQEIGDNWNATLVYAQQSIESDGVFFADPHLDDLEIQRYSDDSISDDYDNMSLTLEGSIGDLEFVYAGAYTDRETEQIVDYTDYLFVGQYLPYYVCDGSVTYPGAAGPAGTCQAPNLLVDSTTNTEVESHEIRVNAPINDKMSITAGAFMSDTELTELNFFTYEGSQYNLGWSGVTGWAPNYPHTNPQPGTSGGNTGAGWYSVPGPYSPPVIFWNDIRRTDEQKGVFGEVSYDLSDTAELTLGARWYDIAVDLEGSANSSFYNFNASTESTCCGANLSTQYAPGNANGYPDKAETDGVIGKATVSWNPSEDVMYYLTWSEGFRPGILNRPVGRTDPSGQYSVPAEVDTDEITNYEFGWKTILKDGNLRFNGSAFYVDVTGLQTTIFDPSIVNLFFSDNAADATIKGVEGDFTYYTMKEGLSVAGAFSMLETEITDALVPTNDVTVGSDLAFAPGLQGNVRVRQEWGMSAGNVGHMQVQFTYSDDSYSDVMNPNKALQDGYSYVDMRLGVSNDELTAELYIDNVTDERAEISNTFVFDRQRVAYIRPTTIGIRVKKNF